MESQELRKRVNELLGLEGAFAKPVWPLPNMVEINEARYWWSITGSSPKGSVHYGQLKIAERDPHPRNQFGHPHWGNLIIYLMDSGSKKRGGFAVLFTYNWMDYNKTHGKGAQLIGQAAWDPNFPPVRYFEWSACAHDWKETGPVERRSRGWHVYTCSKCGDKHTVDSSD